MLLVLLAGMLLYMGIVKITAHFVTLSSYMGINEMGNLSLAQIPDLVLEAYQTYIRFFIRSGGTIMPGDGARNFAAFLKISRTSSR